MKMKSLVCGVWIATKVMCQREMWSTLYKQDFEDIILFDEVR